MITFFKPLKPVSTTLFFSLIAGILSGHYFFSRPSPIYLTVLLFCGVLVPFLTHKKKFAALLLGLFFCFGVLSIQDNLGSHLPPTHISNFLDLKKARITGEIVSFVRHYKRKQTVTLLCQTIETKEGIKKNVTGKINLNLYRTSEKLPVFGDIVTFDSVIKSPRNFKNPGAFDYVKFLRLKGIYGTAYSDAKKVKISDQRKSMGFAKQFIQTIDRLRTRYYFFILDHTRRLKGGNLTASLITGKKEILSPDFRDLFSKVGISHLFAISGLHLSIVCTLFYFLFFHLFSMIPGLLIAGKSRKMAAVVTLFPILCYTVFSGFSPSSQRALIMITVVLSSIVFEKEKDIISSLSVAGILILVMDPGALFSISFQLSFMAVIFIIFGISLVKQLPFEIKQRPLAIIGLMTCVTFFANLGTLPLTAHYFHIVSFMALISNLLFIPVIGFIVLPLGLVSLAGFSFFPLASGFIVQLCTRILWLCVSFSNLLVTIPFSWVRIQSLQWIEMTVIYLIFFIIIFALKGYKKVPLLFFALSLVLVIFNFFSLGHHKPSISGLQITVIDVGQGSSALIETSEGKTILVDGGGFSDASTFDTGRLILAPFLWKKGIDTLDYVILSHPESDHLNGLIYIMNNFKVGSLVKNSDERKSNSAYRMLINNCQKEKIKILDPSKDGELLRLGETHLVFFNSKSHMVSKGFNNRSLVFKVVFKDFSMLFPGDILADREKTLSIDPQMDLQSDILLSPHHGSTTSSTKFFLEKVQPMSVIVSCGWNNRYGFPHDTVLERYKDMDINIFRTDADGAIFISSDGINHDIRTSKGE